jgi:predicted phosphodiesterase
MTNGTFAGVIRNGYADFFFNYTFLSVTANATIFYKLFDSNTLSWGSQLTFITAPPVDTKVFSFLALGDSRTDLTTWSQIANLCNSKHANFTTFNGDVVDDGTSNSEWDGWFNNGVQYLQNNLLYHCLGNHDADDTINFENIFTLPMANNSTLHYFFTYGNAIFICMNTEDINSLEYNWMVNVLQANQSKTWKVVFFHRPFFTIGPHAGEMNGYLSTWWTAFDTYGVDLVLNGHDHMYERSKPINYTLSPNAPVSQYGSGPGQGRCEIVCGGAGAPLYTGTPAWFTQTYQSSYNFCKINVNDLVLTDSTFDNNNDLIETFSLSKNATGIGDKNQVNNAIYCRPNPTEGVFTMYYHSQLTGEAMITITDMNGKTVVQDKKHKSQSDLEYKYDLSGQSKGVYFIQVKLGEEKVITVIELK